MNEAEDINEGMGAINEGGSMADEWPSVISSTETI